MKSLLASLALTTALTLPGLALARPVTLTTTLNTYGGDGAYLALYVTDTSGAYVGSLWMAGGKSKYYQHLSGWYAATGGDTRRQIGDALPRHRLRRRHLLGRREDRQRRAAQREDGEKGKGQKPRPAVKRADHGIAPVLLVGEA